MMIEAHHFLLLRHGLSTANEDGVLQGQHDYPLSEAGLLQVKLLGEFWLQEGVGFDRIISSPLARARETASLIAETLGTELVLDERWVERQLGEAQGKSYTSLQQLSLERNPTAYEAPFRGAETEWDLYLRAAAAVQALFLNEPGKILVVSHGAMLSAVMRTILGQPPAAGRVRPARFSFHNTGHSHLSYDHGAARWTLHYHNQIRHLRQQAGDQ